jgi:Uma2 family endonuclease
MTAEPLLTTMRFTVEDYERMSEVGILRPESRVELLDGEIVEMSPIGPPHSSVVNRMTRLLVQRVGEQAVVVVQNPLRLVPSSEPEPDFVLAAERADFYGSAHPTASDVLVVIEVSDSSLRRDRLVKVPIYAREWIPEVWIVDIGGGRVHVHTDPADGEYRLIRTAYRGEELRPTLLSSVMITVDEILGGPT